MKSIAIKYIGGLLFILITLYACTEGSDSYSNKSSEGGVGGSMARFAISGDYLYAVNQETMKLFDLSNPEQPKYLKGKDQSLGFGIETVFPMDTLLFIGSMSGMHIFNIKRPDFPQHLSFTTHISSCDPVVAAGNYAYVTLNSENVWCGRSSNILQIYDIANPGDPKLLTTKNNFIHPRGLGIDGNKLFICDNGIKVFDVSNPLEPVWIDDLGHISEVENIDAYDLIPNDGILLVTSSSGFYQFDYTGERLKYISKIEVNK